MCVYAVGPYLCCVHRPTTGGMLHIALKQSPIYIF